MAEAAAKPGEKLKVFVSYSRADLAFADELAAGLDVMGFLPLIDRHSIREGEDWKTRLGHLIADAGTVVFVLSPDSAKSPICAWEVEEAAKLSKRILPVLWRPLGSEAPPPRLSALNYTRFDPDEKGQPRSFMEGLKALSKALNTDLYWLNEHTRLLARALEWERGSKADNRLMSGKDIEDAKAWAARRPNNAPELTSLHLDYIKASEDAEALKLDAAKKQLEERERLAREREEAAEKAEVAARERAVAIEHVAREQDEKERAQRRNGRLLWGVALLVLVMLAGALWQSRETQKRELLVFTSLAATAMNEDRFDRASRFALQANLVPGVMPWTPVSTALEGRLAGAQVLTRLQKTLRGHKGSVSVSTFSPDGKRVVTASRDNSARIWDAETGHEIAVLKAHTSYVLAASFSPDGKRVVTASSDETARLWDAETGQGIAVLKAHTGVVTAASFSPDGKRVVTASYDKTARLWDAETGTEIAVLKAHTEAINAASFSPDGKRVVTASYDQTARLWDAETGTEIAVLKAHTEAIKAASFSPDGKRVVTASYDQTARLWDAETGLEIAVLKAHTDTVRAAWFSPDGKRVVTASSDQTARLWDAETGQEIAVLKAHTSNVLAASFSPDGKRVVTASDDQTARLWDAETGQEIAVWKAHVGSVIAASFSPDGKRVVTASSDQTARLWDAETGKETTAAGGGEPIILKAHEGSVRAASFSPDGKRVVTASDDKTARLWDAETGQEIAVLKAHEKNVTAASFSPNGKRIVTGGSDKVARIWDVEWVLVYGADLREKVCTGPLANDQAFTSAELTDPILSEIDPSDPIARNPCLRRGPLHWEYYTQAFARWSRWAGSFFPAKPAVQTSAP